MNVEDTNQSRAVQSLPAEQATLTHETELPGKDPQPPRRGWRRFLVPAIIALVILGGAGWIVVTRIILPLILFSQMKPMPTPVGLATPKSAAVADSADYAATLESRQSVTLQPRVSGQISAIYVKAGDRVEEGTPILQIDAAEQQAQVQSRVAAAETSAADVKASQADVENAQDTLRSLQARRASSVANVQLSRSEYERYQKLYTEGAESKQVLDQKLNALQVAEANLNQIDADIRAQQAAIAKSQATVARSQRAFQEAQANINQSSAQLRYYTINAPFSGVVGNIPVKIGDFVDTTTRLVTVTQNQQLEIQIPIPLERASALRRGQSVQLLDDQNRVLQTGQIFFIAPNVDPSTQSVQVKAVFQNPGSKLRTDQYVRARVIWDTNPGVLVPTTAISRLAGRNFIFVAVPFQTSGCKAPAAAPGAAGPAQIEPNQLVAVQKPIQLGKIIGNDQEVLEGLSGRDRIVVSGILQLQNCLPIAEAKPQPQP